MIDPFSPDISFPKSIDTFPSLLDVGVNVGAVPTSWTKVWASHYNKIANVITTIQKTLSTLNGSASGDGSMKGLTRLYTFPPVSMSTLVGVATNRYLDSNGTCPPTNVIPFQFVLTSNDQAYSAWPKYFSDTPMLSKLTQTQLDAIFGYRDIYSMKIMASCAIQNSEVISPAFPEWSINSWVSVGEGVIVIQGTLINTLCPVVSNVNPPLSNNFGGGNQVQIICSLFGVQE